VVLLVVQSGLLLSYPSGMLPGATNFVGLLDDFVTNADLDPDPDPLSV